MEVKKEGKEQIYFGWNWRKWYEGDYPEVDAIMSNIYGTLQDKYGLDETAARELMNTEDALTYTIALSDIVSGN